MSDQTERPWYRQFYPWMLIALPASAVIAGFVTLYIAISHPDALVRKDCVRDGATIVCGEDAPRSP
ncbi:MAG: FixH family protein [Proteobacteria bacterium]|nr:FixH family protein [Pseudomonadota bacterium]